MKVFLPHLSEQLKTGSALLFVFSNGTQHECSDVSSTCAKVWSYNLVKIFPHVVSRSFWTCL